MADVTLLLHAIERGDPRAAGELLPLVYDELRRLAAAQMAREKPGHTLNATALVHEAYLRLVDHAKPQAAWEGRRHFLDMASLAMRRILVEAARRRNSRKRGGDQVRHDLDEWQLALPEPREDLVALDEALQRLAAADAPAAQLVQLRYFGGCSMLDAAEVLGVSPRTAHRLWAYARAFLHRELRSE